MQPHFNTKNRMGNIVSRKVKTGMMHIVDLIKAHATHKAKKVSAKKAALQQQQQQVAAPTGQCMKAPLTRQLTADEITEAELALKRIQAEKKRLEDLLNRASDRHLLYTSTSIASTCSSTSVSTEDISNNNVKKELVRVPRYQQKVAFMLHNVFTEEECDHLLTELEDNIEAHCKCTSNSQTSTTHSESMAKRLWPVLQSEVPKTWMGNTLLGLSNRCVLDIQQEGYCQKPHMDEAYEPIEGKEKSFFSVYVFLNDNYEGGQSSFLKNWQPSAHDVQVKPKKGSVFVHQHNLLHEIKPVLEGEKCLARFDVMYNTSKRDILAEMYD